MNLLIVDDEPSLRRTFRTTLEALGHTVIDVASGPAALELIAKQRFDLAFLDLRLGRSSGLDLLPGLVNAGLGVVVMTAYASVDTAVEAMRRGAFDYLPKPFTPDQVRVVLDRWSLVSGLRSEVADLRDQVRQAVPEADLETTEPAGRAAYEVAFRVAATEATVLIRGENGTGKGVLARAVHDRSRRVGRPFVTVHCPSLSAELLESDLFGHAKGSFTGAITETDGKV
ncbi:MAG TPA: sigma 54-interacting transcriptional regulator, partial [Gemmataceae bacterium]|nr:sigma 54-interacting transcriptional regulator [Gemmataceae bacterium]